MIAFAEKTMFALFRKDGSRASEVSMPLVKWQAMAKAVGDPLFRAGGVWIYQYDVTGENYELLEVDCKPAKPDVYVTRLEWLMDRENDSTARFRSELEQFCILVALFWLFIRDESPVVLAGIIAFGAFVNWAVFKWVFAKDLASE